MQGVTVLLYTDCPLVTLADIENALTHMRLCGASVCSIHGNYIVRHHSEKAMTFAQLQRKRAIRRCALQMPSFERFRRGNFAKITQALQAEILTRLRQSGVRIVNDDVYIEANVRIGRGSVVYPYNVLMGNTSIGTHCTLMPFNCIQDSRIERNVTLSASHLEECRVEQGARVGCMAHLRAGSHIGKDARVGNFVEVKNATLGKATKAAHLAYIGDATTGEHCNIGCGSIFANYNGKIKQKTSLGNGVFVGSNSNLVAPLTIGDNAFIAAGSTVTQDVPQNALVIARAKEVVKPDWTGRAEKAKKREE